MNLALLTENHVNDFVHNGVSVVDGLVDIAVIDVAEKEMDAQYAADTENPTGIRQYVLGAGYEGLMQDPAIEQAAKEALACDAVHLVASATLHTVAGLDDPGFKRIHVDVQYNTRDWLQEPRSVLLTMMIFLDDVPAERAPTLVSPGSHLEIARYNDEHGDYSSDPVHLPDLPDLAYNEMVPLVGKRGQVALATTAVLHVASPNKSDKPRKVIFLTFTSTHVCPMFNSQWLEKRIEYLEELERRFAPGRKHLVTSSIAMMKDSLGSL